MAKIADIIDIMCELFPPHHRFGQDNIGLLVGDSQSETHRVLCCLDVTDAVVSEAISADASLIISHHPIIFSPLPSLTNPLLLRLVRSGISVYSAHTNMDFSANGINKYAAKLVGLSNIVPLDPYISAEAGFGMVGDIAPLPLSRFLDVCATAFGDQKASLYAQTADKMVKRVAVINGGGGGDTAYVDMALAANADCLITGDIKHHVAIYARALGIALIEIQHYLCEKVYIPRLVELIGQKAQQKGIKIEVGEAKTEKNPRIIL